MPPYQPAGSVAPTAPHTPPLAWDIFCTVVDNYGDIGVCWRLARQLAREHGFQVRLWVDDLASFHKICPSLDPTLDVQRCSGVDVRRWPAAFPPVVPADVVIEAFGCKLPEPYLSAMAACAAQPCWINLEYLSAESWVAGCHRLPSPHPRLPLVKYFFFPGFTPDSGGLLLEQDLLARRAAFQQSPEDRAAFWGALGLPVPVPGTLCVSLFCYENTSLPSLLTAWADAEFPVCCLVPEGKVAQAVAGHFGRAQAAAGDCFRRGNLTACIFPFLEQTQYDRLLWVCDCNFVRGEDSFVRAQWAAKPLVWHIYPQEAGAHENKLSVFLDRYCDGLPTSAADAVRGLWWAWNGRGEIGSAWRDFRAHQAVLESHASQWSERLRKNGDLATNLAGFCNAMIK